MKQTAKLIEKIVKAESDLDEQLHAGSFFYFPTTKYTYQSSNLYMYPICLCIIGYFLPQIVNYYRKSRHSSTYYETTIYFILSHLIGLAHLVTPGIIEKAYSFFTGTDSQLREELPEPVANILDTRYVSLAFDRRWSLYGSSS